MVSQECTAIVVSWNCLDLLRGCLTSLRESVPDLNVVVVDNASDDGTPAMVRSEFPEVNLLDAGSNVGFAAANNLGARAAHSPYLLFLNPDTVVPDGSLEVMAAELAGNTANGVALVGPKLQFPDGRDQPSAFGRYPGLLEHVLIFNPLALALIRKLRPGWDRSLLVPQPRRTVFVAHVNGAAMLTTAEAFNRVGGFDENFFVYFEETDLCRSYQEAGYRIAFVPGATIVHHMGGSSGEDEMGQSAPLHMESMYRFYRKHYGRLMAATSYFLALAGLVANVAALRVVAGFAKALGKAAVADSANTWLRFSLRALVWHRANFGAIVLSR